MKNKFYDFLNYLHLEYFIFPIFFVCVIILICYIVKYFILDDEDDEDKNNPNPTNYHYGS
jgi:hypothetical protein